MTQVDYENDESVQNPQLGNNASDTGSIFVKHHNTSIPSLMTQDPVLTMNSDQFSTDQSGTTMENGNQTMLDTQLPTLNTFDQGT